MVKRERGCLKSREQGVNVWKSTGNNWIMSSFAIETRWSKLDMEMSKRDVYKANE